MEVFCTQLVCTEKMSNPACAIGSQNFPEVCTKMHVRFWASPAYSYSQSESQKYEEKQTGRNVTKVVEFPAMYIDQPERIVLCTTKVEFFLKLADRKITDK